MTFDETKANLDKKKGNGNKIIMDETKANGKNKTLGNTNDNVGVIDHSGSTLANGKIVNGKNGSGKY
jgi:hypothetical protein